MNWECYVKKEGMIGEIEELAEYGCFNEDYSGQLTEVEAGCRKWAASENTVLISEDSLNRTLQQMQDKTFAILTAYRAKYSKRDNIVRNRSLRA